MRVASNASVNICRRPTFAKRAFLTSLSATALWTAGVLAIAEPAQAQQSGAPAADSADTIVVTGSLVAKNGFEAPTPVTVMNQQDMEAVGATNFADFADKLPVLQGGFNSHTGGLATTDGNGGTNSLNLRNLGANRTLVLLDGVRVAPNNSTGSVENGGAVDINVIPDAMIKRMDVVTGGATATYGSGAVAGVVNLILDTDFTGLKGSLEGGMTTHGDDGQYVASLTAGSNFADGRGHFVISGEDHHVDGVGFSGQARPWINAVAGKITNPNYTPTNGQPFYIVAAPSGSAAYGVGGLITSGPLKGTAFTPNGTPTPYNYGTLSDGTSMLGGNQVANGALNLNYGPVASLDASLDRKNLFGRVNYDITDHVQAYAQYDYAWTVAADNGRYNFTNLTIQSGNPFIPTSIQQQMTTDKLSSISLGDYMPNLGVIGTYAERRFGMYLGGFKGDFDLLGTNWQWNIFATDSNSHTSDTAHNVYVKSNLALATDAVVNPANGQVVCRSTLTNPSNGCSPYNPFGLQASQSSINYLLDQKDREGFDVSMRQYAGTFRGEPFSTWAGPVSIALGAEHDRNAATGSSNPIAMASGFLTGNFNPTLGSFTTTEGFMETLIPLAKDYVWAKSLDLNGGVRVTEFSTSGEDTTWKVGVTYAPIDDVRFRATRSRDTRAPNLGELFSGGLPVNFTVNNPWMGNKVVPVMQSIVGNPAVQPESADTTGAGIVVQPSWLKGFQGSFDYYKIDIQNSLVSLALQTTINDCFQFGTFCNNLVQDSAHNISLVYLRPENTGGALQKGFDVDVSYKRSLGDFFSGMEGLVTFRAMATHLLDQYTIGPDGTKTPGVIGISPTWHYTLSLRYDADNFSVGWTGRGENEHPLFANYTQCTSSCPTSKPPFYTVNINTVPADFYMDMFLSYRLDSERLGSPEFFINAEDIADVHPTAIAYLGDQSEYGNPLGRTIRAGFRFKM